MAKPKTNEADIVKLVWRLFTIGGCVVAFVGYQLFTANAEQDVQISGMVGQAQFSQMFAQVQTENRREHDIILGAVASNTEETEKNSVEIVKVGKDVSKILGILKILVGGDSDDGDDG